IRKSTDGGRTWTSVTNGITNPQYALFYAPIVMDPSQNKRLFYGTDVVNETTDGAASWHQLANKTLPYATGIVPIDGPKPVVTAIGISRFNPNIVYVAVNNRGFGSPVVSFGPAIYRIDLEEPTSGGPFWRDISPVWTDPANGFTGLASSPRGSTTPGRGGPFSGINVNGDLGSPSTPPGNSLPFFTNITALTVDPFDSNILYAVDDAGDVMRSTTGGATWVRLNKAGLPTGALQVSLNDIVLDPNLLGVGGQIDDTLYIATNIGVYSLTNPTQPFATQAWTRVGRDVAPNTPGVQSADQFQAGYQPDARVDDLEINTSTGLLVAGTHGRGIWQFQVRPY